MVEHRQPPKPLNWDNPQKGTCRFCNLPVLKEDGTLNTRSHWHPICVVDYQMIHWPGVTRKAVWMRDEGKCAICGFRCQRRNNGWHLDHIRPLIESNGDIRFWQMDNLQTLCKTCHIAKTSREATERATARRLARENQGIVNLDPTLFSMPQPSNQQQEIRDKIFARESRGKSKPPRGARRRR
jgi:hypothetical protein